MEKNKNSFLESIKIKEDKEKLRLNKIKLQYENGEIDEEDLTEEDIEKLIKIYEEETKKLNEDTQRRKVRIRKMLNELKQF